jgi:hypothetical protein
MAGTVSIFGGGLTVSDDEKALEKVPQNMEKKP